MIRRCSPARYAILYLSAFTLLLMIMIMYTLRECNDEELMATKSLLQKYSNQVQKLKSKNHELKLILDKTENKFQDSSNMSFVPGLPIIYILTPTYTRLEQKAELTRMSHTLKLVKNIHWIIVEDSEFKTDLVTTFLKHCGLSYTHLNVLTPPSFKLASSDPNWLKPRGVLQRNAGLRWLRNNEFPLKHKGVLFFGDDDNTYSLGLFEEVVGWFTYWKPSRPFALDMAGFAVNLQLVLDHPKAAFSNDVQRGYQESTFLTGLGVTLDDLEPKANLCTEIIVWHTRTEKSSTKNEDKLIKKFGHGSDLTIEV